MTLRIGIGGLWHETNTFASGRTELADFASYAACQRKVQAAYQDQDGWARTAVLNIARMGKFSSDRTIKEYADEIWKAQPVPIEL